LLVIFVWFGHTCPHENERGRECVIFVLYYTLKSRISRKSNIRDYAVPASVGLVYMRGWVS